MEGFRQEGNTRRLGETLYLASFLNLLFAKAIGLYDGQPLYNALLVAGVLFFLAKVALTDHTPLEYAVIIVLFGTSVFLWRRTGEQGILLYMTMMLGVKGVDVRRLFRWGAAVWSVSFLCLLFLTQCGFIPERILLHPKHWVGLAICHSFGYAHPNVLHISYVILMAFVLYMAEPHIRLRERIVITLLLMAGNVYLFFRCMSFTGAAFGTIFLILHFYLGVRKNLSRAESVLLQSVLPACVLFSVAGPVLLLGRFQVLFDKIDSLLNTRYYLSYLFLTRGDIGLLGHRIVVEDWHETMDVSYVYLLVQLGIIPFVLILGATFFLIRDCIRSGRHSELAIILGLSIAGVSEPFLYNSAYKNLIFIFLGIYLYRRTAGYRLGVEYLAWKHRLSGQLAALADLNLAGLRLAAGTFGKGVRVYMRVWRRNLISYAIIFFFSAAVGFSSYHYLVERPQRMYVGESYGYGYTSRPVTMTEQDLRQLMDQGGMLVGPAEPEDLYVTVPDETLFLEYIGMSMDVGFWLGILVVGAVSIVQRQVMIGMRIRRMRRASDGRRRS